LASPDNLLELTFRAFATFFATVGPVDVAAFYAALTAHVAPQHRRRMAIKGTGIATVLLLAFVLVGELMLRWLGITLAAMRAAGGILLLLLAIDMVFARPEAMSKPTFAETSEAEAKDDISVFPLATPLIAGPAALGAAVLLAAEAHDNLIAELAVIGALLLVMALQLGLLLVAARLHAFLGISGQNVISRIVGILLAALAVQFVFDGIRAGELLSTSVSANVGQRTAVATAGSLPSLRLAGERIQLAVAAHVADRRVAVHLHRRRHLVLDTVGQAALLPDHRAILAGDQRDDVVDRRLVGSGDGAGADGRDATTAQKAQRQRYRSRRRHSEPPYRAAPAAPCRRTWPAPPDSPGALAIAYIRGAARQSPSGRARERNSSAARSYLIMSARPIWLLTSGRG
jgi:multiple antibiotic resistance protein